MKKHKSTILLLSLFLVGLAVLLYPSVSNYLNQIDATRAVNSYDASVKNLTQTDYDEIFAAAQAYNAEISGSEQEFYGGAPHDSEYASLLNINGDGMIGYVTIKKLNVQLPIYHGTDDEILKMGAGHLEGSSLPVGGAYTHAVITGHRGLPAAKLFTDLDKMEVGDTFKLTVLNKTMTYQVDKISIVDPGDTDNLEIKDGGDYVTLLTCTPYGINTQRLLVHGVRTDNPSDEIVLADAYQIDPVIVSPIVAAPMLTVLLIIFLVRTSGKKQGGSSTKTRNRRKEDK